MTATTSHMALAWNVVSAAAAQVGVNPYAVISDIRTLDVGLARHVAMYVLRTRHHLSYSEIGKLLDRDHSTVMYGYRKIYDGIVNVDIVWTVSETLKRLDRVLYEHRKAGGL